VLPEAADQRTEQAELIGARADHFHLGPGGLALRKWAEVMTAVPQGVSSGKADDGDWPETNRPRALQAGLESGREHHLLRMAQTNPGENIDFGVGQ
jgi:hypothetical protein